MTAETPDPGRPPAPRPDREDAAPWVLGVVGGVASGKSAVARAVAEAADAVLIDGDAVGHRVLEQADVAAEVRAAFPSLAGDGAIDRRELGRIVFAHAAAMGRLEAILHPRMRDLFAATITAARRDGRPVVFDAAVLLESGWDDLCDAVAFVEVPEEERRRRAALRGWDEARWRTAEASQWPVDRKRSAADFAVDNAAAPDRAAAAVLEELKRRAAATR